MEKKNRKSENETALVIIPIESPTAETLQQEIERKTAELQKCLYDLERKKQLSENRNLFLDVLDKLENAEDRLIQDDSFITDSYKLKFSSCERYNEDDVFSIGNREVIIDFVHFIRGKITDKIRDLEAKLIA